MAAVTPLAARDQRRASLAARGFVAERTGRPYQAAQVSRMLAEDK